VAPERQGNIQRKEKRTGVSRIRLVMAFLLAPILPITGLGIGLASVMSLGFYMIGGIDLLLEAWQSHIPNDDYKWLAYLAMMTGGLGGMGLGLGFWYTLILKSGFLNEAEVSRLFKW